jgi:hypothetical protein
MGDAVSDELSIYQKLAAPFDLADHAKVNKGSGSQTYAPWTSYVERLNDVLGQDWSFRVIREGFTPTECWVLGEITAVIDGTTVTRQQYGCEPITKGQRETPTADLLKTAASDAIKKAASLLGPGLYLSIKEEREAVEAEMRAAVQAEAQRQADERAAMNKPNAPRPFGAPAAGSGADTASATGAASSSRSSTDTTADQKVRDSAVLTGANPIPAQQQRWQRLVKEAQRINLPTLGAVKAIDPKEVSEAQLKTYADRLEQRLYEAKEGQGAA